MPLFETVTDLSVGAETLRRRRYGVIETRGGALARVLLRPLPTLFAWEEVWPAGGWRHASGPPDLCRLYYNAPRSAPGYLALRYVATTPGASYKTFRAALTVLDQIAEIRGSDALVCDAANHRLSDRFLRRMGWEPHKPELWRRNYIRRFYGVYPGGCQ